MTALEIQLAISKGWIKPAPQPRPFKLRLDKRATANRLAMRRKRAQWHEQGRNSHGKPIGSNAKYRDQKYLKFNGES